MASKLKFKKEYPKKSKSKAREDESWILEGIVAYLRSPTWTVPVLNFVEENCGVFHDSEENKFEYTEVHKNYKRLVESLLVHYMRELELTESQFSQACSRHNRDIAQMDENFEYIWAADDFLLFKHLMLRYNHKIEMEALNMFKEKYVGKDSEFTEQDAEAVNKLLEKSRPSGVTVNEYEIREQEDLELAIEFSRLEMERLNALAEEEKKLMDQAIRLSLESSAESRDTRDAAKFSYFEQTDPSPAFPLTKPVEIEESSPAGPPADFSPSSLHAPPPYYKPTPPMEAKDKSTKPSNQVKKESKNKLNEATSTQKTSDLPPLKTPPTKTSSQAAADWLNEAMKEITESPTHAAHTMNSGKKPNSIDPEELSKRRAHLQEQREKLLALKKKEREKQLLEYNEQKQGGSQTVVAKEKTFDPEEEKKIASRRAVAERLKREVINKK